MKKQTKSPLIRGTALFLAAVFAALSGWFFWCENNAIVTTEIAFSEGVPAALDGMRILQVSDLHNKTFGENSKRLLDAIRTADPDLVIITGDIVDNRITDTALALDFVSRLVKEYPVYYATGNHEISLDYPVLMQFLADMECLGVHMLENRLLFVDGEGIPCENPTDGALVIAGLSDVMNSPYITMENRKTYAAALLDAMFRENPDADGMFTVLLSHRPEYYEIYDRDDIDITFSGHAHGGQFRLWLPFFGEIAAGAPGQGLFPKWTAGLHKLTESHLIISRGLGESVFPTRLFNRPELVLCVLIAQDSAE